jgi:hypothetical protein
MTVKQFQNLKWGQLIFHEQMKRMFLVLGWTHGKTSKRLVLRARPSFMSPKVVYFTTDSAKNLKITHL